MKSLSPSQSTIEISIVVPVYNEEKTISEFLRRIIPIVESITEKYEIIFSLDPSTDSSQDIILKSRKNNERIKLLTFSRKFGQPMATLAGMQYSRGNATIVIDVDLQDPPELIIEMVKKWREGYDVVMAQRRSRSGESSIKKIISYIGYLIINKISDQKIEKNTGDFRLMSRRVVDEVVRLKESHGFLRGLVAIVGFKQTTILFDRAPRFSGRTHYNRLFGSLRIGLNGMICFSNYLLSLSSLFGFLIAGGSIFFACIYAVMKIFGFPFPIGNPTIVILVLFMGGIQLITIGVLGEYIGRIYEEVKQRPKFILDTKIGFDK